MNQFAFPQKMNQSACCSITLSVFGIVSVLDFNYFSRCLEVCCHCFNLQFLKTYDIRDIIWCKELTHLKRTLCWERLRAGGEGDDRGWDGWMATLTRWTWVWVNSRSWWWTGRPGMLRFMGLQRVGHDWVTELKDILMCTSIHISSVVRCPFRSFAHFLTGLFSC